MKKVVHGLFLIFLGLEVTVAEEKAIAENQPIELDTVEVFGVTPLSSSGIPLDQIPANVQSVSYDELTKGQTISVSDYLNRYFYIGSFFNFSGILVAVMPD
jgi:hypothetical protein